MIIVDKKKSYLFKERIKNLAVSIRNAAVGWRHVYPPMQCSYHNDIKIKVARQMAILDLQLRQQDFN
jgi:hypothetical protein